MGIIGYIRRWWRRHKLARDPLEIKVNGIVVGRISKWQVGRPLPYKKEDVVEIKPWV